MLRVNYLANTRNRLHMWQSIKCKLNGDNKAVTINPKEQHEIHNQVGLSSNTMHAHLHHHLSPTQTPVGETSVSLDEAGLRCQLTLPSCLPLPPELVLLGRWL